MLSGVASDEQVKSLVGRFSGGELVRMMNLLQQTMAGFTRNASRRMDAELCIINMCQPELSLDAQALNARLTRLEEQIATGSFVSAPVVQNQTVAKEPAQQDDDRPPVPDDADAPPDAYEEVPPVNEAPAGFWMDVAAAVRKELKPPISGFFAPTSNAHVQGVLRGNQIVLECSNDFTLQLINKPDILSMVARKASAKLGRPVTAVAVDKSAKPSRNAQMERLLDFGRAHNDIIKINE